MGETYTVTFLLEDLRHAFRGRTAAPSKVLVCNTHPMGPWEQFHRGAIAQHLSQCRVTTEEKMCYSCASQLPVPWLVWEARIWASSQVATVCPTMAELLGNRSSRTTHDQLSTPLPKGIDQGKEGEGALECLWSGGIGAWQLRRRNRDYR